IASTSYLRRYNLRCYMYLPGSSMQRNSRGRDTEIGFYVQRAKGWIVGYGRVRLGGERYRGRCGTAFRQGKCSNYLVAILQGTESTGGLHGCSARGGRCIEYVTVGGT